jgi:hypothetical protein
MAGSGKRYFTREEAERLIPRLQDIMRRVMDIQAETARLRTELDAAQRAVTLKGGVRLDQEFWRSRKLRLARGTAELRSRVGEILGLGGVPKDLGLGLVDFPALLEDREINLCWRFGEQRIRFWHGLDEGYGSRKPLPDTSRDA